MGDGATPFPGLLDFTLDPYLIMLSVKQGSVMYHFLSLWYNSTRNWTQVSRAIGEHSNHYANVNSESSYSLTGYLTKAWEPSLLLLMTFRCRENNWIHTSPLIIRAVKCNQPRPGFEVVSLCPYPSTILFTNPSARAGYDTRSIFQVWIQSFPSPRLVASPRLKNLVCPTIYP